MDGSAIEGVGVPISRTQLREALMQIKGTLVVLLNITVTSVLSLTAGSLEFKS